MKPPTGDVYYFLWFLSFCACSVVSVDWWGLLCVASIFFRQYFSLRL